jgi:hypothetical protein
MGPRAGLDAVEKRKIPCLFQQSVVRPIDESLYRPSLFQFKTSRQRGAISELSLSFSVGSFYR